MSDSPTDVLRAYLDASEAYDFERCWRLLCAASQLDRPLGRYLEVMRALPRGRVPSRIYGTELIDGDRATVVVTWMAPDPDGIRALGQLAQAGVITGEEFGRRIRDGEFPVKARDEVFELRLETGAWRLVRL
jgi:hypothetical protein